MATFRSKEGKELYEDSKKRKIVKDGIEYLRVARPKYKSRATRLEEALDVIRGAVQRLEDVKGELEAGDVTAERFEELVNEAEGAADDISSGSEGVSELQDEMSSWRDNIEEKFSGTQKYEDVSNAADTLDSAYSTLESISLGYKDDEATPLEDRIEALTEAIQSVIDEAENGIGEAEGTEFPGMY